MPDPSSPDQHPKRSFLEQVLRPGENPLLRNGSGSRRNFLALGTGVAAGGALAACTTGTSATPTTAPAPQPVVATATTAAPSLSPVLPDVTIPSAPAVTLALRPETMQILLNDLAAQETAFSASLGQPLTREAVMQANASKTPVQIADRTYDFRRNNSLAEQLIATHQRIAGSAKITADFNKAAKDYAVLVNTSNSDAAGALFDLQQFNNIVDDVAKEYRTNPNWNMLRSQYAPGITADKQVQDFVAAFFPLNAAQYPLTTGIDLKAAAKACATIKTTGSLLRNVLDFYPDAAKMPDLGKQKMAEFIQDSMNASRLDEVSKFQYDVNVASQSRKVPEAGIRISMAHELMQQCVRVIKAKTGESPFEAEQQIESALTTYFNTNKNWHTAKRLYAEYGQMAEALEASHAQWSNLYEMKGVPTSKVAEKTDDYFIWPKTQKHVPFDKFDLSGLIGFNHKIDVVTRLANQVNNAKTNWRNNSGSDGSNKTNEMAEFLTKAGAEMVGISEGITARNKDFDRIGPILHNGPRKDEFLDQTASKRLYRVALSEDARYIGIIAAAMEDEKQAGKKLYPLTGPVSKASAVEASRATPTVISQIS